MNDNINAQGTGLHPVTQNVSMYQSRSVRSTRPWNVPIAVMWPSDSRRRQLELHSADRNPTENAQH